MEGWVNTSLHPTIRHLQKRLESLLALVQFERNGQPFEPDGFRLRDPAIWAFDNYTSVFDSLGPLSGFCNLQCNFCYEKGTPALREDKIVLGRGRNPDSTL